MAADDVAPIDVVPLDVVPVDAGAGDGVSDDMIGEPTARPARASRRMPRTFAAILAVGTLAVGGWSAVQQDLGRPRPASPRPTVAAVAGVAAGAVPGAPYVFGGDRFGKTAPPGVEAATCAHPTDGTSPIVIAEPASVQAAIRAHLPGFVVVEVARTSRPRSRQYCGAVVRAHRLDGSRLAVTVDGTGVPDLGYSVDAWIEDGMVTTHVSRIMTPVVIDIELAVPRGASAAADAAVRSLAEDPRLHA